MIEHVTIPVRDYERAKDFYAQALEPLGYILHMEFPPDAAGFMEGGHTSLWIGKRNDPQSIHVALRADNKESVDAFYAAALTAGGADNGPPGYRDDYGPGYYAAFVHDPDGNNIEAVFFESPN